VSDVPSGDWSALLVGHQWPDSASLAALVDAARRRAAIAVAHTEYAENLRAIRTLALANQQGETAANINAAFENGEHAAKAVSDANATKENAYGSALRHTSELRGSLTEIASRGNSEIQSILTSKLTPSDKLSAIVTTIVAAQTHANAKAAECSANLFETIQPVCQTATPSLSARQFATANGVDLGRAFGSPDADEIGSRVEQMLRDQPPSAPDTGPQPATGSSEVGSTGSVTASPASVEAAAIPDIRQASSTEPDVSSRDTSPADAGRHGGTAFSTGAEAITATVSRTLTHHAPTPSDSPGPVFERADAAPPRDAAAAQPVVTPSVAGPLPPGLASSAMKAVTPIPTTKTTMQQGPLTAYGADLKPTPPGAPALIPAAPGSASAGPAGSAGPGSPAAVVRRRPPAVGGAAPAPVTGQPERAFAAVSTAEIRLRRILAAVARQRPQLRWAVGDLVDGNTVLVTDLAGGWIPPDIHIPVGVDLLKPGPHRNNLTALLGEATLAAVYEPAQPLDPEPAPVQMSTRSRETAAVEDLGWELSQATKWRDGLPRLAHTLTRAVIAQTGYLDTEVRLLREHLRAVTASVLDRYPTRVDLAEVGNWQLLATIDALVNHETTSANYHFAWFLAQSPKPEGRR
jgi:hypothetical protein